MLGEVNATAVTLVPKSSQPETFADFHPISVCNAIYRVIFKIISTRLQHVMPSLISSNQSVFIRDRLIHENSLLCYELVHNYHLSSGPPRMAIKIDLRKAFDFVRWDFLVYLLEKLNFSGEFIL
mgnify:CR=1 FL=1